MKIFLHSILFIVLLTGNIFGRVWHVPLECGSITTAISMANDGDTVLLAPGYYVENVLIEGKRIVLSGDFLFDSTFTLIPVTVIDGSNPIDPDLGSVVTISGDLSSGSEIIGLTLTMGIGTYIGDKYTGGGILILDCSACCISQCLVVGNSATCGGGVAAFGSAPRLYRNSIIGNSATSGGGVYLDDSPAIVSRNIFVANNASGWGGALSINSAQGVMVSDNIFYQNTADSIGGIYCIFSYPTIQYNNFWNNIRGNFSKCVSLLGDTSCCLNYNHIPCDNFSNIFRDPKFSYFETEIVGVECSSDMIDAGSADNPSLPYGGKKIDIGMFEYDYLVGDVYPDSVTDVTDLIWLVDYIYNSAATPCPWHRVDWNCDCKANLIDITQMVDYIFNGGPGPCTD